MREIIIIISIIIIVIVGTLYIHNYLEKTTGTLVGKLENLKEDIEEGIDTQELEQESEEVYSKWDEINEKWSNIILHEEIDSIETALIRAKSKIKIKKQDESIEDIETAIFLVNHIKEKEKTSLKNIF